MYWGPPGAPHRRNSYEAVGGTNLGFKTNLEGFLFVLSGLEIKILKSLAILVEFKNYKTA